MFGKKTKATNHSPLKDKPLRNPGQSLEQEISRIINDEMMERFVPVLFIVIMAGFEWYRYWQDLPPKPVLFTLVAIMLVVYFSFYFVRARKRLRSLKLGLEGEKVVGQFLEKLRSQGCEVFHDIIADNFNLDHVLVSSKGIFVVETKTYSKFGKGRIGYKDGKILINGHEAMGDPVKQSLASAGWLSELLKESTGKKYQVGSFIVFPGWFIEPDANNGRSSALIVNPKFLSTLIDNMPDKLPENEVKMAAFHLSRYIRFNESLASKRK